MKLDAILDLAERLIPLSEEADQVALALYRSRLDQIANEVISSHAAAMLSTRRTDSGPTPTVPGRHVTYLQQRVVGGGDSSGPIQEPQPRACAAQQKSETVCRHRQGQAQLRSKTPHQCQCIQGTAVDHGTHSHPVSGPRRSVRVGFRIDLQPVQPTGKVPCSRWGV